MGGNLGGKGVEHVVFFKIPEFQTSILSDGGKKCGAKGGPLDVIDLIVEEQALCVKKDCGFTWKVFRAVSSWMFQSLQLQSAEQVKKMSDQKGLHLTL